MRRALFPIAVFLMVVACGDKNSDDTPAPEPTATPSYDAAVPVTAEERFVPTEVPGDWWLQGKKACPEGADIRGAAPPKGTAIWCEAAAGVKDGPFTAWHEGKEAVVARQGAYREGAQHGIWFDYWPSGKKRYWASYKAGKRHGLYREYSEAGKKRLDGWYEEGVPHGTFNSYDSDAQFIANTVVTKGTGPMKRYHGNRTLAHAYELVDGEVDGTWTSWDENGTKTQETRYQAGKRQGPMKRWGPTGLLVESGNYVEDMKHGDWIEYRRGKPARTLTYRRGERVKP